MSQRWLQEDDDENASDAEDKDGELSSPVGRQRQSRSRSPSPEDKYLTPEERQAQLVRLAAAYVVACTFLSCFICRLLVGLFRISCSLIILDTRIDYNSS